MILAEAEDPGTLWPNVDEVFQLSNDYDYTQAHNKKSLLSMHNLFGDSLSLDGSVDNIDNWGMSVMPCNYQLDEIRYTSETNAGSTVDLLNPVTKCVLSLQDIEEYLLSDGANNSSDISPTLSSEENYGSEDESNLNETTSSKSTIKMTESDLMACKDECFDSTILESNCRDFIDYKHPDQVRRKSVSQALAWYQNNRKRKHSSTGSVSRVRNPSISLDFSIQKDKIASLGSGSSEYDKAESESSVQPESSLASDRASLSSSDMEVYGRIPSNYLDTDNALTSTNAVVPSECGVENLEHMLPDGYSVHNIDGYLFDTKLHNIFDDHDESFRSDNIDTMQHDSEKMSFSSSMLNAIADRLSTDVVKTVDRLPVDFDQARNDSVQPKSELPSDCVTFPDEMFASNFTNLDETVSGNDAMLNCMNDMPKEAEVVRRRPGRPRKKSISQSVAWYRSHRRRQASMSNSSVTVTISSSSREHSWDDTFCSPDHSQFLRNGRNAPNSGAAYRKVSHKTSKTACKSKTLAGKRKVKKKSAVNLQRQSSWGSSSNDCIYKRHFSSTTISYDSDDDAIVDVETVTGGEACSVTDTKIYLPLINAFHNYCSTTNIATQRTQVRDPAETKFKLVWSPERRTSASTSEDCSSTTKRAVPIAFSPLSRCNPKQRLSSTANPSLAGRYTSSSRRTKPCNKKQGFHAGYDEQRSKREALNDLERQRRREMTREIYSLRVVVPGVKDNPRAAKVAILNAASNHIRALERTYERNKSILVAEMQKMAQLKARFTASPLR